MPNNRIEKLTLEQESLIFSYQEKWRNIVILNKVFDRYEAQQAVKAAYELTGRSKPKIIFSDSTNSALKIIFQRLHAPHLLRSLRTKDRKKLSEDLGECIARELPKELMAELNKRFTNQIGYELDRYVDMQMLSDIPAVHNLPHPNINLYTDIIYNCINPKTWENIASKYDFIISELNCIYSPKAWEAFQNLIKYCGWIFPFEKLCLICDYPLEFLYDSAYRLHAEGEPTIKIANGCDVYAYHGVILPAKYGIVRPQDWQVSWFLEEQNVELRRVLIQEIGYERIAEELQATVIDSYQEYTLLKISDGENKEPIYLFENKEPIYLLKMTCPSTGRIHALRVPPNIQSAHQAISWVNWGVDPEDFAIQT
ncbi:DUF6745 domain-containing protein [Nostoc sp.]|uniref:DUF6745 domain-containing protein n=1 Tax=Nostoc sp. TaxID=1180 RepID=UPI002FF83438